MKPLLLILFTGILSPCVSQVRNLKEAIYREQGALLVKIDDSTVAIKGICRKINTLSFPATKGVPLISATSAGNKPAPVAVIQKKSVPFLQVTGNILYDFYYRSYIDTPYAQHDLMQHTLRANLQIVVANRYPVNISLNQRRSNSPNFLNTTDVNLQFRQSVLLERIKADLRNRLLEQADKALMTTPAQLYNQSKGRLPAEEKLLAFAPGLKMMFDSLFRQYVSCRREIDAVSRSIAQNNNPQSTIEQREALAMQKLDSLKKSNKAKVYKNIEDYGADLEQAFMNKMKGSDSVANVSALSGDTSQVAQKKKQLIALTKKLAEAERNLKLFQKKVNDSLMMIGRRINRIKTSDSLLAFLKDHPQNSPKLTAIQKYLLQINTLGIGRTWLDYSELTVKNLSLNGFNVEMNPGRIYFAFAKGQANYRFRDFVLKPDERLKNQSLNLLRAGWGRKEGSNIILTLYQGNKLPMGNLAANNTVLQKITGVSVEARIAADANNYVAAELARSTTDRSYQVPGTQPAPKIFNFKTRTNEAWSIRAAAFIRRTQTGLKGFYRKTGESFESFTTYAVNAKQDAWLAAISQSFWKKRMILDASIRKNDFISPYMAPGFSSSVIFKTLQFSLRIPKYPFITLGYYPSSQLMVNDSVLYESQYNTFNAMLSHTYKLAGVNMSTSAVMTRFFNNSTDTGFIYFNAHNYSLSQTVFAGAFTLEGLVTLTDQQNNRILMAAPTAGYQFKKSFNISAGLRFTKWNAESLWGGTGRLSLVLQKIGSLELQYEKIYLPGRNVLMPVDIGRLTFSRAF